MHATAPTPAQTSTRPLFGAPLLRALGRAASITLPLLLAVLQGCASAPPVAEKPVEKEARTAGAAVIPPQAEAELAAAMALVKAEQYEKSIDAFKKLAAALPDNAIPPTNLALVYKKLGQLDLAETQLKQALTIEPTHPVASNELALLYRKTGRFAEARPVYEKVLAKYPNFNMAHKNLGVLCDLYLKDYECALTHYKVYALSAPEDKSVQIWIADLQKRSGK